MTYQFKIQLNGITKPPVWRRVRVPANFTFEKFHLVIQAAFGWENYHMYEFSEKPYSRPSITNLETEDYWGEEESDEDVKSDEDGLENSAEKPLEELTNSELLKYLMSNPGAPHEEYLDKGKEQEIDSSSVLLSDIFGKEGQRYTYIYDFGDGWVHSIKLEKITNDIFKRASLLAGKGACPPEDCGGVWGYYNLINAINRGGTDEDYDWTKDSLGLEEEDVFDPAYFDLEAAQSEVSSII